MTRACCHASRAAAFARVFVDSAELAKGMGLVVIVTRFPGQFQRMLIPSRRLRELAELVVDVTEAV